MHDGVYVVLVQDEIDQVSALDVTLHELHNTNRVIERHSASITLPGGFQVPGKRPRCARKTHLAVPLLSLLPHLKVGKILHRVQIVK